MITFIEWANKVDQQQIDTMYDKAHIAVELAQQYTKEREPDLLANVSTIANLASGAYGLYNTAENQKKLPPEIERWLIYRGVKKEDIGRVPQMILKKWGVDPQKIEIGDTIHVNVKRILNQSKNNLDAVLQIASTILHEATHAKERESTGQSSEMGPKRHENDFMTWAQQKMDQILKSYPELNDGFSNVVGNSK